MSLGRHVNIWAIALCLGLPWGSAAPAQDGLTPEAAAQQIATRFGVDVLKVTAAEYDGRPVYILTVMNPGGDSDGAFQVTRLMVDRSTGELVPQFRHEAGGYRLPGGAGPNDAIDGRSIRRRSLQGSTGAVSEQ